ncbi:MAG: MFS transporter [Alphaproteobacteria bacterium]|nr:MAG: MFS transporter [Alphaproteobacteria bacterium]
MSHPDPEPRPDPPAPTAAGRIAWRDVLGEGRAVYTAILNLGIGLHAIDVFIISTVMPAVVDDIGGAAYYAWSTMLYMVASIIGAASGGPVKAALGPRHGYVVAGLLFLLGSAGCGASPDMLVLLAMRTVQGFGGGLLLAQSMALVGELYPAALRTRILALISGVWGVAALIGPMIGGVFAELDWWRGAFWASLPVILAFTWLAWRSLPTSGRPGSIPVFPVRRLGLLGAGVLCVGLASTIENRAGMAGLVALAFILVGLTLRLDHAADNRLFPSHPASLRSPVGTAFWIFFLTSITHVAVGVFLPLVLQVVHGVSPLAAGYFNAVLAVAWTTSAFVTAHWRGRAVALALIGGQALSFIGMAGLALGTVTLDPLAIACLTATVGFGVGSCNLHLTAATMRNALPGEESITASSIPTMRSLGIAFGAAGAGLIANLAGLGQGISVETVARAVTWVDSATALAPAAAILLALRVVALQRRADRS